MNRDYIKKEDAVKVLQEELNKRDSEHPEYEDGELCALRAGMRLAKNIIEDMPGVYSKEIKEEEPMVSKKEAIDRLRCIRDRYRANHKVFGVADVAIGEKDVAAFNTALETLRTSEEAFWRPIEYDGFYDGQPVYDVWECSECGWEHSGDDGTLTPYCPMCGAKMEPR